MTARLRPPTPTPQKPLPYMEPLGRVRTRFCKLYSREHKLFLKTHTDNSGDFPTLFIDWEKTPEWGDEIHIALTGHWHREDARESGLKPETRVDGYIPLSEAKEIKKAIDKLRWFKCENCGELLLQELGEVRGFVSSKLKREVICCYDCLEKHEMGEWGI